MTVCYLFLWPLQLVCSQGMSTGVAGWVTEVSCGGWGGLEEKVFVICWRWGQRGKVDRSRFPAAEPEVTLREMELRNRRRGVDPPPSNLLPWEELPWG